MKELGTALAKAQAEIKAALKDSKNPHFKSSYADLTSVWDACRSALTKNGLSVIQKTDFSEGEVWLETMLLHSSGEHITGRYPLRPQQQTPQGYGSALTYARRYSLAAMVGVVADEDDDGNAASAPRSETIRPVEPPQSTMAGRKNEAAGIRAAREWANESIAFLKNVESPKVFSKWYDDPDTEKRRKFISREIPEDSAALETMINKTAERFNTLAAG